MVYRPDLNRSTLSGEGVKYRIRYKSEFAEPGDPRHDESHIHDYYEIYFNLQGDVSFWVNNRLYSIKSGDMIVTRPGDVHLCIYHSPALHEHFCLWMDFEPDSAVLEYLSGFFTSNYYSFGSGAARIRELFSHLYEQSRGGGVFLQTVTLLEIFAFLGEKAQLHSAPSPAMMPAPLQEILNDINDNFAEFRHVGDIIGRHYISQATMNRWFRKYLNISPREFLEAKKLSYAKALLESGHTVTEACMLSGFSDCSHFISVFKGKFGETPFKYKQIR